MRLQLDLLWQVSRVIILETVDYRVQAVVALLGETVVGHLWRLSGPVARKSHGIIVSSLRVTSPTDSEIVYVGNQTMPWFFGQSRECRRLLGGFWRRRLGLLSLMAQGQSQSRARVSRSRAVRLGARGLEGCGFV